MKIIAHRGNDGIHKENSLESILNSVKSKYTDGVEFDVRLTKDNKLIINHDPFYNGYYINHTNSIKLQRLGLNTLDEVLQNINSDKIIMIEVKSDDKQIKKITKILLNTITKYNLNYYICSFNYKLLQNLKNKNLKLGLIISLKINEKHINNDLNFISVNYLYNKKIPSKETFKWTINNKKELEKITEQDSIITDNPKEIYKFIKES